MPRGGMGGRRGRGNAVLAVFLSLRLPVAEPPPGRVGSPPLSCSRWGPLGQGGCTISCSVPLSQPPGLGLPPPLQLFSSFPKRRAGEAVCDDRARSRASFPLSPSLPHTAGEFLSLCLAEQSGPGCRWELL